MYHRYFKEIFSLFSLYRSQSFCGKDIEKSGKDIEKDGYVRTPTGWMRCSSTPKKKEKIGIPSKRSSILLTVDLVINCTGLRAKCFRNESSKIFLGLGH